MGEPDLRALAAEPLARVFHETYERLAPSFGYETREASAKPWAEVPEQNRALMTAVCGEVLAAVLPAHRRQVLAEAIAAANAAGLDRVCREGIQHDSLRHVLAGIWQLAGTAPPAAPTASQSVQDAPVVPVEAPTDPGPSEAAAAPLDGSPWHAGGTTPQTAGRHIYRAGGETPIGSMDTPELAAQVVAEHGQARHNRAELAGADTGAFIAVPRAHWREIQRDRARDAHAIDGLAAAADRLAGAQGLADLRGRLAVELIAERDRLAAELAAARAALAAFGAGVDWSRNGAAG